MNTINAKQIEALVQNNAIKSISIAGIDGGFLVSVNGTIIEAARGHARVFKKLNTAASFLKNKGIGKFSVDVSNWSQDQDSAL